MSSHLQEFDDGRNLDISVVRALEDSWVDEQMHHHRSEFMEMKGANISVCTWNVNGKKSDDVDLRYVVIHCSELNHKDANMLCPCPTLSSFHL
jgi:hypothetical protein